MVKDKKLTYFLVCEKTYQRLSKRYRSIKKQSIKTKVITQSMFRG